MSYKLPPSIYNRTQLRQLQRQLEQLKPTRLAKTAAVSDSLQDLLDSNRLGSLSVTNLEPLRKFIADILQTAPQLSITLASLPNPEERAELINWLRNQFSPILLVHFIQSDDVLGGCIVRTNWNVYDLSLRQALDSHQNLLAQAVAHV